MPVVVARRFSKLDPPTPFPPLSTPYTILPRHRPSPLYNRPTEGWGTSPNDGSDATFAHNNVLHRNHFRKDWQSRVKTWFDQPGRKQSRRVARQAKAVKAGLRPVDLLRPAVRCPTMRYNTKLRCGRGFTAAELKAAGIPLKKASSIGLTVDHRRRNRSEESLKINKERLEAYQQRLVVFPKKAGKVKKGDTEGAEKSVEGLKKLASAFPVPAGHKQEGSRAITSDELANKGTAYTTLRKARSDQRYAGIRAERQKKKEEEAAKKK
ncbi:BQ2448_141 [Microbotryum intermedium]|uniref:BQ2448_141 protein n=1 Tax=Microbotryum intermedium TaxID=269621 RepID=A0A238F1M6_9BASI|nr:BQ2448_141 [Microbotryum intermedium]